jgi:hypothetical protein
MCIAAASSLSKCYSIALLVCDVWPERLYVPAVTQQLACYHVQLAICMHVVITLIEKHSTVCLVSTRSILCKLMCSDIPVTLATSMH